MRVAGDTRLLRDQTHLVDVVEDGGHDGDEAHLGGEVGDAQQRLELLQRHDDRRAGHEPHQRSLRQEVDDETQPACVRASFDHVMNTVSM